VTPSHYPEAMTLSHEEREQFLAEPHVAALAVPCGPGRGPLTVPIWYHYTPGGEPWILTQASSRKARLIQEAGHFSLMVDRLEPTTRYVTVEGDVSRIAPGTDALREEMVHRYLDPEAAERYFEFARAHLADEVAIYMRPQRWLSSDMGVF
jgi:nitroimidazol reductase NimA-like FMN-containing flavoprotein (pyridoxamine 5'-phosphate oxidase superfamily)